MNLLHRLQAPKARADFGLRVVDEPFSIIIGILRPMRRGTFKFLINQMSLFTAVNMQNYSLELASIYRREEPAGEFPSERGAEDPSSALDGLTPFSLVFLYFATPTSRSLSGFPTHVRWNG